MRAVGAEGLSDEALRAELQAGARLVVFSYAVSVCVLSFARDTPPHLLRAGESGLWRGLPYTLLTLALGWWGLPFGPVFTVAALVNNLGGGQDVTHRALGRPASGRDEPSPGGAPWQRHKAGDAG